MTRQQKSKQSKGTQIFFAQRAAEQLLERTQVERGAVMGMSRDEVAALAKQMLAVSEIAADYHRDAAGSDGSA